QFEISDSRSLSRMYADLSGEGLQWSFAGANGFDFWVQNAYYTNSPLWLPLCLLPERWLPAAVDLIVALHFGLAGLTCGLWLSSREDRPRLTTPVFAAAYALCAWSLAFINQLMWTDVYVLLPLVVLGLSRLVRQGRWELYVLSLALTLWTNFYIGWMVCLFCVLWFAVLMAVRPGPGRGRLRAAGLFAGCSLLAGALAAPVLIPAWLGLRNTVASTLSFGGELKFYHSIPELLSRFLPFSGMHIQFEAANLYCGLLCVPLGLAALFDRRRPLGARLAYLGLCLFLLVSFELNLLDYLWHGFHFPNQLPGRQSFLFSFLLVTAAHAGLETLRGRIGRADRPRVRLKTAVTASVCGLLLAGVSANAVWTVAAQCWSTDLGWYTRFDDDMAVLTAAYAPRRPGPEFWRCEMFSPYNFNPGQLYGFPGVSWYSSTMSAGAYDFYRSIGQPIYASNVSTRYVPNPLSNALLGVRYVFDNGVRESEITELNRAGLDERETVGSVTVYENAYALPLGFCVDRGAAAVEPKRHEAGNAFLNRIFRAMVPGLDADLLRRRGGTWSLDAEGFRLAVDALRAGAMTLERFSNSEIVGRVEADG
ncbi:MAG: YfhO family protein, partial [Oscillospiraceae bacterium]|nr:YfhO family protein [Oscillospiraceae bacterium]